MRSAGRRSTSPSQRTVGWRFDVLVATPTEGAAPGRAGAWSSSTPPTARGTRRVSQAPLSGRSTSWMADISHRRRDRSGLGLRRRGSGSRWSTSHPGATRRRCHLEAGDVGVDDYRALSSGAAQLWADGAVTLYDRTGRVTQQLDRAQRSRERRRSRARRDMGRDRRHRGSGGALGGRSRDRSLVAGRVPDRPWGG